MFCFIFKYFKRLKNQILSVQYKAPPTHFVTSPTLFITLPLHLLWLFWGVESLFEVDIEQFSLLGVDFLVSLCLNSLFYFVQSLL